MCVCFPVSVWRSYALFKCIFVCFCVTVPKYHCFSLCVSFHTYISKYCCVLYFSESLCISNCVCCVFIMCSYGCLYQSICLFVCICVCVRVHIDLSVWICVVCMLVCICLCLICVCMCICMFLYMFAWVLHVFLYIC